MANAGEGQENESFFTIGGAESYCVECTGPDQRSDKECTDEPMKEGPHGCASDSEDEPDQVGHPDADDQRSVH